MTPTLILASSSPRRRELLTSLGIPFTILKPDIDETQHAGEMPLDYVRRLSREKAEAVASSQLPVSSDDAHILTPSPLHREGEQIILAADTVVILGADTLGVDEYGDILGKPVNADDARAMLRRLRGRTHQVCTAITLVVNPLSLTPSPLDSEGKQDAAAMMTRVTCTDVTMRDYTDAEIEAYLATGDPFDKAGSYAIQHPVFKPVTRLNGCYANVVGLPVCTLKTMFAEISWPGMDKVEGCNCDETMLRP